MDFGGETLQIGNPNFVYQKVEVIFLTSGNLQATASPSGYGTCMVPRQKIIPSQMEVAPLHRTVDISHKRRLFKNTKEI